MLKLAKVHRPQSGRIHQPSAGSTRGLRHVDAPVPGSCCWRAILHVSRKETIIYPPPCLLVSLSPACRHHGDHKWYPEFGHNALWPVRCGKSRPPCSKQEGPRRINHPCGGRKERTSAPPGLRAETVAEVHGQIPSLLNLSPTSEL